MADENKSGELKISSREELEKWLQSLPSEQGRWVAVAIAARAALRVVPLVATETNFGGLGFGELAFETFVMTAPARVMAKYPSHADDLTAYAGEHAFSLILPQTAATHALDAAFAAFATVYAQRATAEAAAGVHAAARAADAAHSHKITYVTYDGDIWSSTSLDADFIASGGTSQALASLPLWPNGDPKWAEGWWTDLWGGLPGENDWQVWIDWYNRRLEGVSDPEEIELVFATVPDKEREAGPAAANKWIKERLEELRTKESLAPPAEAAPPPQPIENLPSPFTFGRNTAGQITIVAGPQNTPVVEFPGDDATHRRWLETGRKLTERLIADLRTGKFHNVRSDYREGLERYVSDLPPDPGAGNFLLADAEARMLHSLFAAESHIIAEPFAARLKIILENHFALLGFYPEVARYLAAAREGQVTAPLPQEAIAGFGKVVLDNTPQAFTPEVSQGLREAEREAPKVELEPEDIRGGPPPVKPPAYPYDEPDPEKSRAYAMMSTFNALYKTVLETAKNEPSKIVNWIAIEEMLRPYAIKIIELLKTFTPSAF